MSGVEIAEEGEFMSESQYVSLTDEEVKELALKLYRNEIFPSWYLRDTSLVTSVFMPLMFMDTIAIKALERDRIQHFYEDMSKALPRGINGYPMFMSMKVLTREDAERIDTKYQAVKALMDQA